MPFYVELIGYLGSVLVAISLMMSNILRLRVINLIGAVTFSLYGILLGSLPVAVLNGFIALVDIYFLIKLLTNRETFELIHIHSITAAWPNQFIDFYRHDIERYFPGFNLGALPKPPAEFIPLAQEPTIVMIRRNMMPVGIFIYRALEGGNLWIDLDYVIPAYRDLKNARFLYSEGVEQCARGGCALFITKTEIAAHYRYLLKIGFVRDGKDPHIFIKTLA